MPSNTEKNSNIKTDARNDGKNNINPPDSAQNTTSSFPKIIDFEETKKYNEKNDPPLIDLKVTNPVTYLKLFLKKLILNEGIDLRIKIRPFTVILIVLFISGTGFTLGTFGVFFPAMRTFEKAPYVHIPASPTYRSTFYGTLGKSESGYYYLFLEGSQVINLEISTNVNLKKYLGKRLLASGIYYKGTNTLEVSKANSLELLPTSPVAIPTFVATPTSFATPTTYTSEVD